MNHQVPIVSSEELLLSRSICCELSTLCCHGHSLLLSSYLHRISRKKNSACSASGHPLQDLNHFLLDCPASEPLRKSIFGSSLSIFDLWSRPWDVDRLLGLRGVPMASPMLSTSGLPTKLWLERLLAGMTGSIKLGSQPNVRRPPFTLPSVLM